MIEVFKTNVNSNAHSAILIKTLKQLDAKLDIHFDLADCDKILRVEGEKIDPPKIIQALQKQGFWSEVLP